MPWVYLLRRYKNIEFLSVGGGGLVGKAFDTVRQEVVIVKKLKDPWSSPPQALRSYRELKLLRYSRNTGRNAASHAPYLP